jgi:hypothetical protein
MSLEQIVDNTRTDKNTTHSYLPLYESLFKDTGPIKRFKEMNLNVVQLWSNGER